MGRTFLARFKISQAIRMFGVPTPAAFIVASPSWRVRLALASFLYVLSTAKLSAQSVSTAHDLPLGRNTAVDSILRNNPVDVSPDAPHTDVLPSLNARGRGDDFAQADDETRIYVNHLAVTGLPEGLASRASSLLKRFEDRFLTMSDLRGAAAIITEMLHESGESISFAYVPRQDVVDDVVSLAIMRGRLESVRLTVNDSLLRNTTLQSFLDRGLADDGDVNFMREQLARIADLPGVGSVSPTLEPGRQVGGASLAVSATPESRIENTVFFNNSGPQSVGRNQLGYQMTLNSPLGVGDRLQAIGFVSPDFLQTNRDSVGGYRTVGRISYDAPVGHRGARLGAAVQRVAYKVGGRNRDIDGNVMAYSLYFSHPIMRGVSSSADFQLNADIFRRTDANPFLSTGRNLNTLTAQFSGRRLSRLFGQPNIVRYEFTLTGGRLNTDDNFVRSRIGRDFIKSTQRIQYLQRVVPTVMVGVSANAQQTSRNLDGQEQMSLGGPGAVRAYDNTIPGADQGYAMSAHVQWAPSVLRGGYLQVFYDHAHASFIKSPRFAHADNDVQLSGYGLAVGYALPSRFSVAVNHARRIGQPAQLRLQPKAMTWVSMAMQF